MDKDELRRNLTILALNNLIQDYSFALEEQELTQEEKDSLLYEQTEKIIQDACKEIGKIDKGLAGRDESC